MARSSPRASRACARPKGREVGLGRTSEDDEAAHERHQRVEDGFELHERDLLLGGREAEHAPGEAVPDACHARIRRCVTPDPVKISRRGRFGDGLDRSGKASWYQ